MFRLFGFDVSVRPGFVAFTGLIVLLYRDEFGLWLAGSLAAFTLIHELGHAIAARSSGAEASISLDFMAGYTAYQARHPLSGARKALISVSGPAVQIGASALVLAAMGVNLFDRDSIARGSDAAQAIWWAGPAIGALNLIPVLPLDGGHLAQTGVEAVLGRRALREMAIVSVVITVACSVALAVYGHTGFLLFVAFLLFAQLQLLQLTSPNRSAKPYDIADRAEAEAWSGNSPALGDVGQRLSPWWHADQALRGGDVGGAQRAIVDDLRSDSEKRWRPPVSAPVERLRAVVDVLPQPLPAGNLYSERVLADVLLAVGQRQLGGEYAAGAFARHRTSPLATTVARAAAGMGDVSNAMRWLQAAADTAGTEHEVMPSVLGRVMDHAPEFAGMRDLAEFATLRATLD